MKSLIYYVGKINLNENVYSKYQFLNLKIYIQPRHRLEKEARMYMYLSQCVPSI